MPSSCLRQLICAVNVVDMKKEAGKTFSHAELEAALKEHKPAVLFLCQVRFFGKTILVPHAWCLQETRLLKLVLVKFFGGRHACLFDPYTRPSLLAFRLVRAIAAGKCSAST